MTNSHSQKGGLARAQVMTAEQRRESAIKASEARWGKVLPRSTHQGKLLIGEIELDCAVLDDKTRIINQTTLQRAFGLDPKQGRTTEIHPALAYNNLRPYLTEKISEDGKLVTYRTAKTGAKVSGYKAELLPQICGVYLRAKEDGILLGRQLVAAEHARVLLIAFAELGIIALIDEVTGYQASREANELRRLVEKYVSEELRAWVRTFPEIFFQQIFRLYGWAYTPGSTKRPAAAGNFINKYIYSEMPAGVIEELRKKNPSYKDGTRFYRHHQYLTADIGVGDLDARIHAIIPLMMAASDKDDFDLLYRKYKTNRPNPLD